MVELSNKAEILKKKISTNREIFVSFINIPELSNKAEILKNKNCNKQRNKNRFSLELKNKIRTKKLLLATPYIIYAQIGLGTNRQTFNNNIATPEKSPIFTSHKSYTNSLGTILTNNKISIKFTIFVQNKNLN